MCASQNFQIFHSLCWPEAYFRHQQGHHQAGALTGSIYSNQNTNTTVNGAEH